MVTKISPLIPYGSRVIVVPDKVEEETKSGIIIAKKDEEPQQGTVVAVGTGERDMTGAVWSPAVTEGDHILFQKYSGVKYKDDDQIYYVVAERDILAVIK